jgi:TolB-like protein/Flp pilus assembly protein TadD
LLAYLALSPDLPCPREKLMALLWSDRAEEQARASLRQALTELRHALGEPSPLRTEQDTVSLDSSAIMVDAVEFRRLAKAGKLAEAAALYRGALLDGHGVRDGAYEDWLRVERTRLHDLATDVLHRLAESQSGDEAIETAQRLAQLDPVREETHRLLMRLYAAAGQRAQALRQYQLCRDALQQELQAKPDTETERLYREIQDESLSGRAMEANVTKPKLAAPPESKPSIAVLPFANMSGDPQQDYFSDGITEDIVTELSRFRSLFVIARTSSFQYRGKNVDVRQVARELGVQYIVEGSIRRAGNRVRVTAQLVDAGTGSHRWADRFDREFADIFAVQDEVTRRIVTSIAPVLDAESLQLAKRKPPEDMQAYDYFLRAKVLVEVARTSEEVHEGRELCNHAIRIDPTFARAHTYRSMSYAVGIWTMEADDLDEWRKQAMLSAEQAVALDPADALSHWALAWASFNNGQKDRSRIHIGKAISMNPNDTEVLADAAFIHACYGDHTSALQHLDAARERNPSNPSSNSWVEGSVFYLVGRYSEAVAAFEAYGRPNESIRMWRAVSLIELGRIPEARAEMEALRTARPNLTVSLAQKVYIYMADRDDFFGAMRQAGLPD